jgi:para-aminobenzoate synthetase component 2
LIVDKTTLPACLEVTAWTSTGIIMGLRHREFPTLGVQFHPESIATEHGKQILKNFLNLWM